MSSIVSTSTIRARITEVLLMSGLSLGFERIFDQLCALEPACRIGVGAEDLSRTRAFEVLEDMTRKQLVLKTVKNTGKESLRMYTAAPGLAISAALSERVALLAEAKEDHEADPEPKNLEGDLVAAMGVTREAEDDLNLSVQEAVEDAIKAWQKRWPGVLPSVTVKTSPETTLGGPPRSLQVHVTSDLKLPRRWGVWNHPLQGIPLE